MDSKNFNKLKLYQLKEIAKNIGIKSVYKYKKDELICLIYKEDDIYNLERNIINNLKIEDNNINYYQKEYKEDIKEINKEILENLLNKKLKFGDIITLSNFKCQDSYILDNNDELLSCNIKNNNDITIPLKISREFEDSVEKYKILNNINYFDGIELKNNDNFLKNKLGIDLPKEWNYYYLNDKIYGKKIIIDLGNDIEYEIRYDIIEDNIYDKLVNSIEYVKRYNKILKEKYEVYEFYIMSKRDNNSISEKELKYIKNLKIDENIIIKIDKICNYIDIQIIFKENLKEEIMNYLNKFYFNSKNDKIFEFENVIINQ